jgi:hypothetical protein
MPKQEKSRRSQKKQNKSPLSKNRESRRLKDQDELLGQGGCTAKALAVLHVLGKDAKTVAKKLDDQMDIVQEMTKLSRYYVGVEGDYWHPECIRLAMDKEYGRGNYVFRKLHPGLHQKDFRDEINNGSGKLLVEGILNPSYMCPDDSVEYSHEGSEDFFVKKEWRHAIAVDNKQMFDFGASGKLGVAVGVDTLWLVNLAGVDMQVKNGYMKELLKVYKIEVKASYWEEQHEMEMKAAIEASKAEQ